MLSTSQDAGALWPQAQWQKQATDDIALRLKCELQNLQVRSERLYWDHTSLSRRSDDARRLLSGRLRDADEAHLRTREAVENEVEDEMRLRHKHKTILQQMESQTSELATELADSVRAQDRLVSELRHARAHQRLVQNEQEAERISTWKEYANVLSQFVGGTERALLVLPREVGQSLASSSHSRVARETEEQTRLSRENWLQTRRIADLAQELREEEHVTEQLREDSSLAESQSCSRQICKSILGSSRNARELVLDASVCQQSAKSWSLAYEARLAERAAVEMKLRHEKASGALHHLDDLRMRLSASAEELSQLSTVFEAAESKTRELVAEVQKLDEDRRREVELDATVRALRAELLAERRAVAVHEAASESFTSELSSWWNCLKRKPDSRLSLDAPRRVPDSGGGVGEVGIPETEAPTLASGMRRMPEMTVSCRWRQAYDASRRHLQGLPTDSDTESNSSLV